MTRTRRHPHSEAGYPAERSGATFLAVAQRNLCLARGYSPAALAAEDPWCPDPVAELAAWIGRMEEAERFQRVAARRCVEDARRHDAGPDPRWLSIDPTDAAEFADSVMRARGAIAAMLGPDPAAALAARYDVLVRWRADDEAGGWRPSC
ncbi:hypothetical protein GCM10017691_57150 [Pseudonocardia petroleophila]|uniref:Uncharacterized protein n=1 Tax=Pseudonocardia petroleophila TaxID=37331 RepID=A0A7G7MN78_9PSEU|nr:hypothetical protein [Pseudonocardia petroleophila]QNG54239.1 hypothetical protein H6H00_10265 [Pseudonocardia petroleophila]